MDMERLPAKISGLPAARGARMGHIWATAERSIAKKGFPGHCPSRCDGNGAGNFSFVPFPSRNPKTSGLTIRRFDQVCAPTRVQSVHIIYTAAQT